MSNRLLPDEAGWEYVCTALVAQKGTRPFVKTSVRDMEGVELLVGQLTVEDAYAQGVRFISAAIEAERDAGLVKFLRHVDFDDRMVAALITGLREFRTQHDVRKGNTADDPDLQREAREYDLPAE